MFCAQIIGVTTLLLVAYTRAESPLSSNSEVNNGRCGGSIEADYGSLTYPLDDDIPDPSSSGELCIWTIHLKTTSTFRLNISSFDIADTQDCNDGALRIYSLTNLIPANRAESYTFCNSKPPPTNGNVFLSENLITVIYRTTLNSTNSGSGFTLNWEGISIQPIAKTHESTYTTASNGLIRYPVVGEYPPNHVSTWLVNSESEPKPPGPNAPTLQLQLPYVNTEPCGRGEPEDCICDALILYQVDQNGELDETKRFCGNITGDEIQEVSKNFILAFFSDYEDAPEEGNEFELIYQSVSRPPIANVSKTCGGVLSGESGVIEYKLNETYDKWERCIWTIRSEGRTQISLTLTDWGVEYYFDVLEVLAMDVAGNTSTFVFRQIDLDIPVVLKATVAIVSFYTDGFTERTGFSLAYQASGEVDSKLLSYRDITVIQGPNATGGVLKYPENGEQYKNGELSTFVIQHANSVYVGYEPMTVNITALNLEIDPVTGACQDVIRAYRMHSRPGDMIKLQPVRPYEGLCQMDQIPIDPYDRVTDHVFIIFLLTNEQGRGDGFEIEWNIEFRNISNTQPLHY